MVRKKEERGKILEITDPIINESLKIAVLPREKLEVARFQRKPSKAHIKMLSLSIERLGFLVPLVVYPENNKYIIIDGQHRFLAGEALGMNEFLSVIVPPHLGTKMINLNIEKQPNIREKAYVAYNLYSYLLEEKPDLKESESEVEDSVELPHFITLGFAYQKVERFHGSAFEPIISKCDNYLDLPLKEAKEIREKRSSLIVEIDNIITGLINKMKEKEIPLHPFIRKDILSHVNPLKGRRKRGEFDEVFESIKEEIMAYQKDPQKLEEIRSEEVV